MRMSKFPSPEHHIKGWGWEDWITNNPNYCGKILHFRKGGTFSLHYHIKKDETFYVLSGLFRGEFYGSLRSYNEGKKQEVILCSGKIVHIKPGLIHRLSALEAGNIIEFSTQHFEDDSYRLEPGDSQRQNKNV